MPPGAKKVKQQRPAYFILIKKKTKMSNIPKNAEGKEPTQKELLYSLGTMLFDIRELLKSINNKLENNGNTENKK